MNGIFGRKLLLGLMLPLLLLGCADKSNVVYYDQVTIDPPLQIGEIEVNRLLHLSMKLIAEHFALQVKEDKAAGISSLVIPLRGIPRSLQDRFPGLTAEVSSHYQDGKADPRARQIIIKMNTDRKTAPDLVKDVLALFGAWTRPGEDFQGKIMKDLGKGKEVKLPIASTSLRGYVSFKYGAADKPDEFLCQIGFAEMGQFYP